MGLRELYESIGSDYDRVLARLMNNEKFIYRLLKKYEQDTNMEKLKEAVGAKDYEAAFDAAHTLKGLAGNIGLTRLYEASFVITERLRAKDYKDLDAYLGEVEEAQNEVMEMLSKLPEEAP